MRPSSVLIAAALVGLASQIPLGLKIARADAVATRADVIAVKDIHRGMKGYGLTVFEGTKPEKFDVEVIDVLKNFRPRQDLILIKTKHPRLDVAKVVAGMSGSPIFLKGKMAGAYAYGWGFPKESVAGVTPIRNMIDDLERPLPPAINGWPLRALPERQKTARWHAAGGNRYVGNGGAYDLELHARQVAKARGFPRRSGQPLVQPVATPLLMGGMTSESVELAKKLFEPVGLEPLQAGGGGSVVDPKAPTRYENGGAVGVQLIRGDMSGMGLGTVTRVEGDKLVAFGHPMMFSGVTAMPTAIGRVLWFLASDMRSFKIGVPVRPVGALVNDRMASIVVSQSAKAPVIPVTMRVKGAAGAPHARWSFEVAHEKFMTPAFVAVVLGSALQATAAERQDVSWTARSTMKVKGYGEIHLEDFGVSIGGTPSPRDFIGSNLVRAMGALLNNPWKPVRIESVDLEIELRYAREIFRLRGVEALESEIEAGEPARLRLTLIPFSGKPVHRVIAVPVPKSLAGKTVQFRISPGYMHMVERPSPDKLADLVHNLENRIYPPKSVVVTFDTGGGAVMYKGRVAKHLPPGALDLIRPRSASIAPEPFKSEIKHVTRIPQFMIGRDRVSIKVRPVLR